MKKIILLSLSLICLTATNVYGQTDKRPEQKSAKEIAEERTARMDEMLSLTKKQRKKVYKLNLKEVENMQKAAQSDDRMPMGGGPGGAGGGPGGGRMQGGQHPPMDNDEQWGERPQPPSDEMQRESVDDSAKREKQLKKILTEEQYSTWTEIEKESKHKEFQEKLLRDSQEFDRKEREKR